MKLAISKRTKMMPMTPPADLRKVSSATRSLLSIPICQSRAGVRLLGQPRAAAAS
jgi:hypothetical protein